MLLTVALLTPGPWVSLAGAGRRRTPRRRRTGRRPTPTTTGGSCAKPPSAGVWSSKCSRPAAPRPRPQKCGNVPLTVLCRSQSEGPSGVDSTMRRSHGRDPSSARASLWRSEGGDLGALQTPPSRAPHPLFLSPNVSVFTCLRLLLSPQLCRSSR